MAQRKTLTERQVSVLRWIGDTCPSGVMDGDAHRISAAALRNRGVLTTSGRGDTWLAEITEAGHEYLGRVDGPEPPAPRQENISVTQKLVDDVIAGGGSVRVPRKNSYDTGGVDYEKRVRLAERHAKVPPGKRLTTRVVSQDELDVELLDAPAYIVSRVELVPVVVPARVGRLHPAAREFRQRTERHEVSRTHLPRATRILQAIALESERQLPRAPRDPGPPPSRASPDERALVIVREGHGVVGLLAVLLARERRWAKQAWLRVGFAPGCRRSRRSPCDRRIARSEREESRFRPKV